MGAFCCSCCRSSKPEEKAVIHTLQKTKTGNIINEKIVRKFVTQEEQNILKKQTFDLKILLSPPYNSFDKITNYLYLTGFGGINAQNLKNHNIKHVLNVTYELPYYDVPGYECIKIPVRINCFLRVLL